MHGNLNSDFEFSEGVYDFPPSLDQRIEIAEKEIEMQNATIASLQRDGHVTTDASRQLGALLVKLRALLKMKIAAR